MSTTATKFRPMLFSSPMVRALLDGRKTQTRRLVSHNARGADEVEYVTDALIWPGRGDEKYTGWVAKVHKLGNLRLDLKCPYGVPGDMLWVKETHALRSDVDPMTDVAKAKHYCRYRADGGELADEWHHYPRWRPSIHMPRWACRLYLEVVSVRVERLQDISEADSAAEGMTTQLCEEVLCAAAGKLTPQESYYVRSDDEDFTEGHNCYTCAQRIQKKHAKEEARIVRECCPESDGPAYCDECHQPLLISLTKYGIERELFLEGFMDEPPPDNTANFAASGLDAAISGMIAGGIGDLQDEHKPRLNKIGYATLWDSINGAGSWASNPWVWVISFKRTEEPK